MSIREALADIKALIAEENFHGAYRELGKIASPDHEFPIQQRMARLMRAIPPEALGLRSMRIALLAGCTLDHFAEVLGFWAALKGLALDIWMAPFDTIEQTILDHESGLYAFKPDVTWIFSTHRDVLISVPPGADAQMVGKVVDAAVDGTANLWRAIRKGCDCQILHNTADVPVIDVFGNFEVNVGWSIRSLLRSYNLGLAARRPSGVMLFDLDHVAALYGKRRWVDQRYWYHSKHAFAFGATGLVAQQSAAVLSAMAGLARKCLVADLDNTLWGGVIGDDGIEGIRLGSGADGEAFCGIQAYLKALKERGVILSVSSKNDESNAKAPFLCHPDMRLSLDDISVFRANWNNKADNIREIAELLNIGLDSLVFLDDNPVERELVRTYLPMVAVPELPEDPVDYVAALVKEAYFETTSFGDEDRQRATYYRDNARRQDFASSFTNTTDYLKSLEMVADVGNLDPLRLPRVAQLIGKSNQFHLTGTRYSEAQLHAKVDETVVYGRWFGLRDRFGDNGLISAVILERRADAVLHIDTWVMSCRVLSRGMEEFIRNEIVGLARELGCTSVTGLYVPSRKNTLVAGLYARLGFSPAGEEAGTTHWRLELDTGAPGLSTTIRRRTATKDGLVATS
ncbi:HAD-IIIC family phosphatase [Telmatospirillum siberiense]|uniref:Methoxymalonyl-ACP biosynthesis protein FkbH n=1 Tax=Telmatospirillum siberiense TaxID=382514 RepID=A0A2N3PYG4_9PROT|nr:HAD-IIIC family phosphatase [Telmatospirillum siberiense]PKU25401.1 methoxymalonyl-ACP biosynthesis protein FkbH [Telmatospirillum siberiense]